MNAVDPKAPSADSLPTRLRASDRVRHYLENQLSSSRGNDEIKLPPVRDLSRHLRVSTATIYHIFKDFAKEGRLHTAAGGGSYLLAKPAKPDQRPRCIGVSWPIVANPTSWGHLINHAIIQAAMKWRSRLNLRPIPVEAFETKTHQDLLANEIDEIDALIFISRTREFAESEDDLINLYESRGKPVVRFGSPGITAATNFVAIDNFTAASQVAFAWAKNGRRRIAYLMRESLNATTSTLFAHIGLQSGAARGGLETGFVRPIFAPGVEEESGYQKIKQLLKSGEEKPDAIYCFGGFLALGAVRALKETGLRVPGDVSVVGGGGRDLTGTHFPDLTRLAVSYEAIGESIIEMMIERLDHPQRSVPGAYIPLKGTGGESTTPGENACLRAVGLLP